MSGDSTNELRITDHERTVFSAFAKKLGMSMEDALSLLDRFIAVLEIPLGAGFSRTPGLVWDAKEEKYECVLGWSPYRTPRGSAQRLRRHHVAEHLLGRYSIAVARGRTQAIVEIDIDAKNFADEQTITSRQWAVEQALGYPPNFLTRSSESNGRHMRIFLDRPHERDHLHRAITAALRRHGFDPSKNSVEVFPNGARKLRLPLGPQSVPLDPDTCAPVAGKILPDHRVRRDVRHALKLFLTFSEDAKVELEQLTSATGTVAADCSSAQGLNKSSNGRGKLPALLVQGSPRSHTYTRVDPLEGTFAHRVRACDHGVSAPGRRYEESRLRVWDLVVRRGLSIRDAMAEFNSWLDAGTHDSKDLQTNPVATRRRMLKEAEQHAIKLERDISAGRLRRGGGGAGLNGEGFGSLTLYLKIAQEQAEEAWRDLVRSHLTSGDHELISKLDGQWLSNRIGLLIGLIRFGYATLGVTPHVTLSTTVLQLIAGRKAPPSKFGRRSGDPRTTRPAAYSVLLREARRLRLVTRADGTWTEGARARLFFVQLPVLPADTKADLIQTLPAMPEIPEMDRGSSFDPPRLDAVGGHPEAMAALDVSRPLRPVMVHRGTTTPAAPVRGSQKRVMALSPTARIRWS